MKSDCKNGECDLKNQTSNFGTGKGFLKIVSINPFSREFLEENNIEAHPWESGGKHIVVLRDLNYESAKDIGSSFDFFKFIPETSK